VIRDAFVAAQHYQATERTRPRRANRSSATWHWKPWRACWTGNCCGTSTPHRADDIATAIALSEEFGYRLVVNHGTEGHLLADVLAEKNIPVIFGPMFTARVKVELRNRTMRAAGIMSKAGVKVAITTDHPVVPIHFLVHQATLAVKEGMDRAEALRALTVNPAEILRLDDQVGALKPGLDGGCRCLVGGSA